MLTDDDLDRRLAAAGQRWRADHAEAADVPVPTRTRRPLVLALGAAAVVVAVAVGLGFGLRTDGGNPTTPTGPATGTATGGSGTGLTGRTWLLRSANGRSAATANDTATFTRDAVTFDDGVNTGSGPVRITGGQLRFGDLAISTVGIARYDPVHDAVDRVYSGTARWSIRGSTLTLTKGHDTLVYVTEQAVVDQLTGSQWALTGVFEDKRKVPVVVPVWIRLTTARYTADLWCDTVSGALRIDRDQLFLGAANPDRSCQPPDNPAAYTELSTVDGLFGHKAAWSIDGTTLTLANGTTRITFRAST